MFSITSQGVLTPIEGYMLLIKSADRSHRGKAYGLPTWTQLGDKPLWSKVNENCDTRYFFIKIKTLDSLVVKFLTT